jgi:predicted phosphoadenosine phosphosulfate sulfurtransferase
MRVASPFNNCAMSSLKLYKALDPDNWGKMLLRVNGVNFA